MILKIPLLKIFCQNQHFMLIISRDDFQSSFFCLNFMTVYFGNYNQCYFS